MADKKEAKDGYIFDFISGVEIKATPEEIEATQVFSKRLIDEYEFSKTDIQQDHNILFERHLLMKQKKNIL